MLMLTAAEVERIALLARLSLSAEERDLYARQLSAILDYASQLAAVDVEDIPPTSSVLTVRSIMREGDAVAGAIPRPEALANAPRSDGASFVVPAAIDDEA